MNSPHPDFESFYDDQVEAFRQVPARQTLWDRIFQPSIVLSFLILLVTVVYNAYGSTATLEGTITLLGTCSWDFLVFIVPEALLNALDRRANPFPRPMTEIQGTHAAKSETMKRVLGLDRSGGVMASVFQVRNRALSMTGSVLGLKLDSERPAGLGNRDNSCYQNSILQGLSSLKPLPGYLSAYLQASSGENGDRDVAQTLRTLISDLNDASNNGQTLWTPSVLKNMSTWTQQDAQEYYSKILDDIDKSVAKAARSTQRHPGLEANSNKDDTVASQHSDDSGYHSTTSSRTSDTKLPRNPLEGLLAQRVACVQCGHSDGLSMIPFTCLTLSLGLDKNQHDLYERLDAYSKVESIENVECDKCTLLKVQGLLTKLVNRMRESKVPESQLAEPLRRLEAVELALEEDDFEDKTLTDKCRISAQSKVSTTKTKQIVIARPPQSLAIHVNRSVFDPSTFDMMKNSAPVNFPKTLDLGPWLLGSSSEKPYAAHKEKDIEDEEQWVSNPRESMVAGDLKPSRLTGPIYELRAVVTHYGRHENGHYICYRKHRRHIPSPAKSVGDENDAPEPGDIDEDMAVPEAKSLSQEVDDRRSDIDMDWWRLSDHNVSMVNEETVLSLSPGVFMLFYDCVDPNIVLTTEDGDMHDAQAMVELMIAANGTKNGVTAPYSNGRPVEQGVSEEDVRGVVPQILAGESKKEVHGPSINAAMAKDLAASAEHIPLYSTEFPEAEQKVLINGSRDDALLSGKPNRRPELRATKAEAEAEEIMPDKANAGVSAPNRIGTPADGQGAGSTGLESVTSKPKSEHSHAEAVKTPTAEPIGPGNVPLPTA
ncbi:Fc.00g050390.m01.CDS01 [Cosmosporella sp. VM-42]